VIGSSAEVRWADGDGRGHPIASLDAPDKLTRVIDLLHSVRGSFATRQYVPEHEPPCPVMEWTDSLSGLGS
jgi:hypothetical protein